MAISVRIDPILEKELELAAKRQGVTKSQFVIDAVQRALGRKNPYALLLQVQAEEARGVYGKTAEGAAGFKGLYDGDKARAFIVRKLEKKHGVRGPR